MELAEQFWYGEDLDLFVPPVAGFALVADPGLRCGDAAPDPAGHVGLVALGLACGGAGVASATPFLASTSPRSRKNRK
jgi:hypothetical protein